MITAQEQIDLFYNKYTYEIIKLFDEIKASKGDTLVLGKCNNNTVSEFLDLILNNVDLKQMWMTHYNV